LYDFLFFEIDYGAVNKQVRFNVVELSEMLKGEPPLEGDPPFDGLLIVFCTYNIEVAVERLPVSLNVIRGGHTE
jgi:hypothetical protein